MVCEKYTFQLISANENLSSFQAIHDWEQGERRHQRAFHVSPEEVLTETALNHGTSAINHFASSLFSNYECNQ